MVSSVRTLSVRDKNLLKSLLTAVMAMQLMTPFLQSGVAVLLPALGEHFQCSAASLGLVSTVYCMALSVFSLAMGRAGDKWGRRRVCLASMLLLTPVSFLISFCPSIESVITMRFFQGIGTSGFFTCAQTMLMACAPVHMRGRLLGLSSTAVYVGVSLGPLAGGWINALWGWQIFFRTVGLWSLGCFVIMLFLVKREWHEGRYKPYDWTGLVLLMLGMAGVVMGLVGPADGWRRGLILAAGCVLLWRFGLHEYRLTATIPLLDVRVLFHNRLFMLSNLASFMLYASLFSLSFFFSLYLQYARGMNSAEAGAVVFVQSVVQVLFTLPCSWLSDRIGATPIAFAGNITAVASLALLLFLTPDSAWWYIYLILGLNGVGMALFVTPNTVLIMTSVDKAHMSQASGAVGTVRTAGMMSSMVIATFALRLCMGDAPMSTETLPDFMSALRLSFAVFLGLNIVSLLCSLLRLSRHSPD